MCERAELHDPASAAGPGPRCSDPCPGLPPGLTASASVPGIGCFGALSPGPLTRPPTLRPVASPRGSPTWRKGWASRAVDSSRGRTCSIRRCSSSSSPASSCRSPGAPDLTPCTSLTRPEGSAPGDLLGVLRGAAADPPRVPTSPRARSPGWDLRLGGADRDATSRRESRRLHVQACRASASTGAMGVTVRLRACIKGESWSRTIRCL